MRSLYTVCAWFFLGVFAFVYDGVVRADTASDEAAYQSYMDFASLVRGGRVTPGWMADGSSFWFAEGGPQDRVIYTVDPVSNTKSELFDVPRLREDGLL